MEQTFYKTRLTLIQMMKDRGYTHDHEKGLDVFNLSLEEFRELFKNSERDPVSGYHPIYLDMSGIKTKDGKNVYVRVLNGSFKDDKIFSIFDKNKPERSDFIPIAEHFNLPVTSRNELKALFDQVHIIIVYRATTRKDGRYDLGLQANFLENQNIEALPVHTLTFNVTRHKLVNPHRLLSEEKRTQVYEKFNASRIMFNKICLDDPVNLYYGGRPGDMYEISRKGYKPSYRVVAGRALPRKK